MFSRSAKPVLNLSTTPDDMMVARNSVASKFFQRAQKNASKGLVDVVPEDEIVAAAAQEGAIKLYSGKYYTICAIGGVFSCGLTHTAVTPLDLVKCRRQVDPKLYSSVGDGFKQIIKNEGGAAIMTGWFPTLIGYSLQGACKFGFYEFFKKTYADAAGEEFFNEHKSVVWAGASASAEFIADIALCPWEAMKVRIQTAPVGQPFANSTMEAYQKIMAAEGAGGFYQGLTPLWMRQIPYTIMKFVGFEHTVKIMYNQLFEMTGRPRDDFSKTEQLGVTFAAGYVAGVFCAAVSHPADTVVSKLNNLSSSNQSTMTKISTILSDLGFAGVWTGLGVRIFMIGTLTGLQWFIYDTFKVVSGLKASG